MHIQIMQVGVRYLRTVVFIDATPVFLLANGDVDGPNQ